jgi:hypothetical protein
MKQELKPEFETKTMYGMFNGITKIDNAFLQKFADAGAVVMFNGWDTGFWIMTGMGQLWFKIQENEMHLECIAVLSKERKQGKGSQLMTLITQYADEVNIPVSLRVSVVSNSSMMMPHPVVGHGMVTKDKIPVRSLPKWYAKFGFQKDENFTQKNKTMLYTPKKK